MKTQIQYLLIGLELALSIGSAAAQGTAFTYQGNLHIGSSPGSGAYDFTFTLFTTNNGPGQVGPTITNLALPLSNGWWRQGAADQARGTLKPPAEARQTASGIER